MRCAKEQTVKCAKKPTCFLGIGYVNAIWRSLLCLVCHDGLVLVIGMYLSTVDMWSVACMQRQQPANNSQVLQVIDWYPRRVEVHRIMCVSYDGVGLCNCSLMFDPSEYS